MKYISLLHAIDTSDMEWCYLINTSNFEVIIGFITFSCTGPHPSTFLDGMHFFVTFCVDVRFVINSLHLRGGSLLLCSRVRLELCSHAFGFCRFTRHLFITGNTRSLGGVVQAVRRQAP